MTGILGASVETKQTRPYNSTSLLVLHQLTQDLKIVVLLCRTSTVYSHATQDTKDFNLPAFVQQITVPTYLYDAAHVLFFY